MNIFKSYWIMMGICIFEWIIIMTNVKGIAGYVFFATFWFPLITTLFIINNIEKKTGG